METRQGDHPKDGRCARCTIRLSWRRQWRGHPGVRSLVYIQGATGQQRRCHLTRSHAITARTARRVTLFGLMYGAVTSPVRTLGALRTFQSTSCSAWLPGAFLVGVLLVRTHHHSRSRFFSFSSHLGRPCQGGRCRVFFACPSHQDWPRAVTGEGTCRHF